MTRAAVVLADRADDFVFQVNVVGLAFPSADVRRCPVFKKNVGATITDNCL